MTTLAPRMPRLNTYSIQKYVLGVTPFVVILVLWWQAPSLFTYPAYALPTPAKVFGKFQTLLMNGQLWHHVGASLYRLAIGFVLGNVLAIALGIAISMSKTVSDYVRPILVFFQAVAGIAWVPLAIIWFGIGFGPVLFVVTNTMFFGALGNTISGVQQIPRVLYRAARSHGASKTAVLLHVVIPGALVQIILGFRTSMAYGWRALVAGEMLAGTSGLGYLTLEAVQWYETETVVLGMILIGVIWLCLDRLLFKPIENMTVRKWGLIQR